MKYFKTVRNILRELVETKDIDGFMNVYLFLKPIDKKLLENSIVTDFIANSRTFFEERPIHHDILSYWYDNNLCDEYTKSHFISLWISYKNSKRKKEVEELLTDKIKSLKHESMEWLIKIDNLQKYISNTDNIKKYLNVDSSYEIEVSRPDEIFYHKLINDSEIGIIRFNTEKCSASYYRIFKKQSKQHGIDSVIFAKYFPEELV